MAVAAAVVAVAAFEPASSGAGVDTQYESVAAEDNPSVAYPFEVSYTLGFVVEGTD